MPHTVSQPEHPWGTATQEGCYVQTHLRGRRVPGWEDVNITRLAADIGVSFRYLLAVLGGQRNCTLALLQATAQALGIPLTELILRMEKAYELRVAAAEAAPGKAEKRRLRSERRAALCQSQP